MSLLDIALQVQATQFFTELRMSWYVYPVVLSTHLTGIAFFGGMILMTNLRRLGIAFRGSTVAEIVDGFRVPKRIGFCVVATCGILLAGSKAEEYYYNAAFWLKMSILALIGIHAVVFRRPKPSQEKLAAGLSLFLWVSMACAGRAIGYIDAPLDLLHALAL